MRKTRVVINKSDLLDNFKFIKSQAPGAKIIPVVKANSYGHGSVEVSKILSAAGGVHAFAVAYTEEAVQLRKAGIKEPIIILVQQSEEDIPEIVEYDLQPAVSALSFLKAISRESERVGKSARIHLFIDSGMSRDGVWCEDALDFMLEAKELKNIEYEGMCTHFSSSSLDPKFTQYQLDNFNKAVDTLKSNGFEFKLLHTASSAAIINYPEARFNAVRCGIALYGYPPDDQISYKYNIKPILTLKTNVAMIRRIKKGDSVSYNRLFIADKDTNIATLPLGYGDGYFKSLTSKSECIINDKVYPIVGSICMDEVMVDLGDDDVKIGDEVILIGSSEHHSISASDIAKKINTISYEVTTLIAPRVPRVYVD
jgi:alanine racemase